MGETIEKKDRKARKEHKCDLCGKKIEVGEVYSWSKFKLEDALYDWHEHKKCNFLCGALWDYADPEDGMDEDLFCDTLQEVCRCFVCPGCENWSEDFHDCVMDEAYCIDKAYEFFQTHELYRAERRVWGYLWKCRKKEK